MGLFEVRLRCAVHFGEDPDDSCRYSFYCCTVLGWSFADRCVSFSDHIGHPDRPHTDHNRRVGHRDSDHGSHPIFVSCRFRNDRHLDSNRHPDAVYLVIVIDRYLGPGRLVARLDESMYSWAQSGEPGPSLCG